MLVGRACPHQLPIAEITEVGFQCRAAATSAYPCGPHPPVFSGVRTRFCSCTPWLVNFDYCVGLMLDCAAHSRAWSACFSLSRHHAWPKSGSGRAGEWKVEVHGARGLLLPPIWEYLGCSRTADSSLLQVRWGNELMPPVCLVMCRSLSELLFICFKLLGCALGYSVCGAHDFDFSSRYRRCGGSLSGSFHRL